MRRSWWCETGRADHLYVLYEQQETEINRVHWTNPCGQMLKLVEEHTRKAEKVARDLRKDLPEE